MKNAKFETLKRSEITKVQRYAAKRDGQPVKLSAWWTEERDEFTGFVTVGCEIMNEDCTERLGDVFICVCLWDRRKSFVSEGCEIYKGYTPAEAEETTEATESAEKANNEEEEKRMFTINDYTQMFTEDRTAARETVEGWRDAVRFLDNQCNVDVIDGETPAHTVKCFVSCVGENTARFIIASLINQCAWDGRISRSVKEWAENVGGALDEETANRARIYSNMHRAHLDQIAEAMMQYQPEPEETEEAEQTAEDESTESTEIKPHIKKSMLTCDTLYRFEAENDISIYDADQVKRIEDAAYVANMNKCGHPEWTEEDIYNDFLRVLGIHKIEITPLTEGKEIQPESAEAESEQDSAENDMFSSLKKTVTFTHEQANLLACYILMTTNYRAGEAEAWDKLAEETNEDGTPVFKHAKSNAYFWREMSADLEEIRLLIDNAPTVREEEPKQKTQRKAERRRSA